MRSDAEGLWRVVYVSHSMRELEMVERMLADEGFLVRRRGLEHTVSGVYELCALDAEAREARQFISEKGF